MLGEQDMAGFDASLMQLAAVVALCGLIPAGAALAGEHGRHDRNSASLAGQVEAIGYKRITLRADDGRRITVDADRCAATAAQGERISLTGHWEHDGEFEAKRLVRADGTTLACDDRYDRQAAQRVAAAAPVDAATAIAKAREAGFGPVVKVEWEHGAWRLRTVDGSGQPVRLRVDGWTGQVVAQPQR